MSHHRLARAALAGLLLAAGSGSIGVRAQDCSNSSAGATLIQACNTDITVNGVNVGTQAEDDGGADESGSSSNDSTGVALVQLGNTDVDVNVVNAGSQSDDDSADYGSECSNHSDGLNVLQACDTDVSVTVINSGTEEGDGSSSVSEPGSGSGSNSSRGVSLVQLSGTDVDLSLVNIGRIGGEPTPPNGGGPNPPPGGGTTPPGGGSSTPPGGGTTPPGGGGTTPPGGQTSAPHSGPRSHPGTDVSGTGLTAGVSGGSGGSAHPAPSGLGILPAVQLGAMDVPSLAAPGVGAGHGSPLARTGFPIRALTLVAAVLLIAGPSLTGAARRLVDGRR